MGGCLCRRPSVNPGAAAFIKSPRAAEARCPRMALPSRPCRHCHMGVAGLDAPARLCIWGCIASGLPAAGSGVSRRCVQQFCARRRPVRAADARQTSRECCDTFRNRGQPPGVRVPRLRLQYPACVALSDISSYSEIARASTAVCSIGKLKGIGQCRSAARRAPRLYKHMHMAFPRPRKQPRTPYSPRNLSNCVTVIPGRQLG